MSMLHAVAALMPKAPPAFAGLTFKGRGFKYVDNTTTNLVLDYGTVSAGSAPAAGDVVVWLWSSNPWFGSGYTTNSLASPWVQSGPTTSISTQCMIAAILMDAGNLSSPPTWVTTSTTGTYQFASWFAFSVSGAAPTVAIGSLSAAGGGASTPANVTADSSALNSPAVAITVCHVNGDDGSISFTGVTMDSSQQETNRLAGTVDCLWGHKLDVGGAVNTFTGVDNGGGNGQWCGYVSCS